MRKKFLGYLLIGIVVLTAGLVTGQKVQAVGYEETKTESMRDVYVRRDAETKEYRNKILSNSNESVKLLREIRDLLKQQSNTKK